MKRVGRCLMQPDRVIAELVASCCAYAVPGPGERNTAALEGYRVAELARMRDDIFFDAHNFSALRHGFVCKHAAAPVPVRHVG